MKIKIGLPIIVALIVVLGTVGIVVASTVLNRTVNITVLDSLTVSPSGDTPVTIYRESSTTQDYTVTNGGNKAVHVSVSCDTPTPTGITVSGNPTEFDLAKSGDTGNSQVVTMTFAADNTSASSSSVTIHFTAS